ncbi:hypothetical protein [Thalassoroseus pseudoceratinae]|uniref:hypothetical protein n=1 Tax=Thalassoroseus pseudoceratinae TaxID=2713176 RepID=UPI00141FC9BB|nr:hypothetical protein [Thalassoroseus pseudoceratinae]
MSWFLELWRDERGYMLSAEAVLLGTVGVVGGTVGLGVVSSSVNEELSDVAHSFRSLDQSYEVRGYQNCRAYTPGSVFHQEDVEKSHKELDELERRLTKEEERRRKEIEQRAKKELEQRAKADDKLKEARKKLEDIEKRVRKQEQELKTIERRRKQEEDRLKRAKKRRDDDD